jgi:hypothetical protein
MTIDTIQQSAVQRVASRVGEILRAWGPVQLDAATIARFDEAEGWPVAVDAGGAVSPAILLQLGNERADVHHDRRPHETLDPGLKNPVNGGTAAWWTRPLRPDEAIRGEVAIKSAYVREGKNGKLAFVVLETRFLDMAGAPVGRAEKTVIYREGA